MKKIIPVAALLLAALGCEPIVSTPAPQPPKVQEPTPAPATPAPAAETPLVMHPSLPAVDAALNGYLPVADPLEGTVDMVGSDSMDPLVQLWAESFRSIYPKLQFQIISRGSATAPRALLAGTTLVGHMSRPMNDEELKAFEAKYGYAPTRVVVAADALAVYVNANNPIKQLTLQQVDAIFSSTRKAGYPKDIAVWGGLGLTGEWASRAIQPYGRNENSGTRAFFKEHTLKKGEYKDIVKALPDQFATVEAVAMDGAGIAYGPVQHSVRMVKAVPLVDFGGGEPMLPTVENILGARYPLNRFLYIYVNKAPGKALPLPVQEFLTYILSREGQSSVANFGAIPLPAGVAAQSLERLTAR
nr:substrate-binding domain-containing protein [uncultured Holophaga sp.]